MTREEQKRKFLEILQREVKKIPDEVCMTDFIMIMVDRNSGVFEIATCPNRTRSVEVLQRTLDAVNKAVRNDKISESVWQ